MKQKIHYLEWRRMYQANEMALIVISAYGLQHVIMYLFMLDRTCLM